MKSLLLGAILVAALGAVAGAQPTTTPPDTTTPPPPPDDEAKPAPEAEADEEGDDIDSLRQEYLKIRDELYRSRARAAAVSSALYTTKITIKLAYQTGRFYSVDRATIRLDSASVYDDTEGKIAEDDAVRFEGWIAPGRHQVTIRVEATGKDDDRFKSSTEATFVVEAVADKDLTVTARAKDGGDIPYEWSRGEHGSYKLSIDADVRTEKRAESKKAAKKAAKKATKKKAKKGTRAASR